MNTYIMNKNILLMFNKPLKNKVQQKQPSEVVRRTEYCKVSQASNEIMLDRFYKGKEIGFPFV